MSNFRRAISLALRYRFTFAISLVCALAVAFFWGSNITVIYPLVEIAFKDKSAHDWVRDSIQEIDDRTDEIEARLADINGPPKENASDIDDADRMESARSLETEMSALQSHRTLLVHLRDYIIIPLLPDDAFKTLVVVVLFLVIGTLLKSIFLIVHQVLVARLTHLATFDLRNQFYRRTLRMDLASFGNEGTSELMSRFTFDMENLASGICELFGKMIREPLKMLSCLVGAAWICWPLLLLSLVLAPPAAYLIRVLARSLKRANRRAMEEMSLIYSTLEESFQGIKVVKAFNQEPFERHRFHRIGKNFLLKSMRIARYDSLTRPLTELMGILALSVAILAGAYLVLYKETHLFGFRMSAEPISHGKLLMFFGMLAGVSDPFRKMSEVFSRVQRGAAAADRIYQLIDRQPTVQDPVKPKYVKNHLGEVTFENVNFHYKPSQPVLKSIDLSIEPGETIAIVGPNGCGKSSLANLIPRFFDPVSGQVKIDGIDLRDQRQRDIRSQIGIVTQETLLFDDTVYNNIKYGSPRATRRDVVDAAQRAHAHRFIEEKLTDGYETICGPRGNLLSGGQRQRIALARAILRNPSILILDEATSQVDLESEQLIHKALQEFTRDRTTVIITHRMATLALARRIVVMQGGMILDIGTHEELLRRSDLYSRLYAIQLKEIA